MQAWQLTAHGAPEKVLQLRELPDPVTKPGQVLIRSEGFGLNYADVMAVKGLYRDAPPPPCVLGYEVVGRVEKCGDGVLRQTNMHGVVIELSDDFHIGHIKKPLKSTSFKLQS